MIIDHYKFKKDSFISNTYNLSVAVSQSDRIPPKRIKFLHVHDKTSINSKYQLILDEEITAQLIFPLKHKGLGYFETGNELILVNWFPQISRLHLIIIQDKKMYSELLYQMFLSGLIELNIKPVNPDSNVQ